MPRISSGRRPDGDGRRLRGRRPVVGIDLAGSERRRTGFCRMDPDYRTETAVLGSDDEILEAVRTVAPAVVSIDAPLFLPVGRPSIETRGPPHLRASDRILLRLGIRFFPISLGPMRALTSRGIRLRALLESEGFRTIEGYPGASQDLLGIPRKGAGVEALRSGLLRFGISGGIEDERTTHDELDAASAAYLGDRYLAGDFIAVGDPREGWMVLAPKSVVLARLRSPADRAVKRSRSLRVGP
jgi:predicted nuclease with RNAse H fold